MSLLARSAAHVVLTDGDDAVLELAVRNALRNVARCQAAMWTCRLAWGPSTSLASVLAASKPMQLSGAQP